MTAKIDPVEECPGAHIDALADCVYDQSEFAGRIRVHFHYGAYSNGRAEGPWPTTS